MSYKDSIQEREGMEHVEEILDEYEQKIEEETNEPIFGYKKAEIVRDYVAGFTTQEITDLTGIGRSTAEAHIKYWKARGHIKKCGEKKYAEEVWTKVTQAPTDPILKGLREENEDKKVMTKTSEDNDVKGV